MILISQHYKREPKSTLYHYTNPSAFLGIIKYEQFFATQIQYMNDRKEFNHAVDLTVQIIDEVIKESGTSVFLEKLRASVSQYDGARTFIISFSEHPDTLSQWRAYSRGGGFSIGFDHRKLIELAQRQGFSLLPCIYDEQHQRELLKELVLFTLRESTGIDDPSSNNQVNSFIAKKFYGNFIRLAPNIKHPAFAEECEWRLIGGPFSYKLDEAGWRPARGMLVPYHKFSLVDNEGFIPISEVYVGPHTDMHESADSVRSFLYSRENMSKENLVKVKLSSVPYRE